MSNEHVKLSLVETCRHLNRDVGDMLEDMNFIRRVPEVEGLLISVGALLVAVEDILMASIREAKG
jgi:hypothetical protein